MDYVHFNLNKNILSVIPQYTKESYKMFQNLLKVLLVSSSMLAIANGILINCVYGMMVVGNLGNIYTCSATVVYVGGQYVTHVSDNHPEGFGHDDVEGLMIGTTLNYTPRGIHNFFPNLQGISLRAVGSSELTYESLMGLNELRFFDFGGNRLRIIENDLFIDNPLLETIHFEDNPIRHIAHNVFDHLHQLETLFMSGTTCISSYADRNRDDVDNLLFQLMIKCPATFEMTAAKILNGADIQAKIDQRIESTITPLYNLLNDLEEQQQELEQRIVLLEGSEN